MTDPEKKICRYFNTLGGCWYGDGCKFLHIPNKKPPCKFYGSSTGCRYGESCHFSHDRMPFKSVENYSTPSAELSKEVFKENVAPSELSGTNNNNMPQPILATAGSSADAPNSETAHSEFPVVVETSTQAATAAAAACQLAVYVPPAAVEGSDQYKSSVNTFNAMQSSSEYTTQRASVSPLVDDVSMKLGQPTSVAESDCGASIKYDENIECTRHSQPGATVNEMEIYCGSCKRILERRGNESYCTLLKDHYLECFLDKEGDHVKYVKMKAALEPGQMYWCKSCILIFEKPWSLFQHMADKAKGNKVQRWEKKVHLDWMDSVAGLMAAYDLGLFSPNKLRLDLRNLLADQPHTMEEEWETAAVTAAAMMQWLAPLSNPWRLQQREMMRKIEQLNRQMLRKANLSLNATPNAYSVHRAALPATKVEVDVPESKQNSGPNSGDVVGASEGPAIEVTAGAAGDSLSEAGPGERPKTQAEDELTAQHPASKLGGGKSFSDSFRQPHRLSLGSQRGAVYRQTHRPFGRPGAVGMRGALSRASSTFNPPSFHASLDFNCGFTDDEVEELLSQGIKPWDSEAAAALAVLRGELDHLLDNGAR